MKHLKTWEFIRTGGGILAEHTDGNRWWFTYEDKAGSRILQSYATKPDTATGNKLYLGYTPDEIIDSGKDLLARSLFAKGEPSYDDVVGVLPQITEKAYCFIGGPASHASPIVDRMGVIYPQRSGRDRKPAPLFTPDTIFPALSGILPRQYMIHGEMPILVNVFDLDDTITELLYFVEPGDSDRDPTVWIRAKHYAKHTPHTCRYDYHVASISRELTPEEMREIPIKQAIFEGAMADTFAYWIKFSENGVTLDLPEQKLEKVARGAIAAAAVTCTADRPHYGHKFYGKELHDNFPPNYIWLIEAACLMGRSEWAARVLTYMLNYALTDEGRFCYRQGQHLNIASSAAEYGYLLFLVNRYKRLLGLAQLSADTASKLCGMGDVILANVKKCEEFDGRLLVKMCAEADTNSRVFVYLNNNLWAIRGLRALASLIGNEQGQKYADTAEILWKNVSELLEKNSVSDERFGRIPPFRLDYKMPPHTLSNCKDTFSPLQEKEREEYFTATQVAADAKTTGQDITENNYANYRYYPEALSAMLLPDDLANGAEALRENLGGELLCMTRFRSWVDNWPVLHHARFLLESGRIDKYLLLLYAHTEHHGHPDLLCYYEQIKLDGSVSAPDCLPALLTTPTMIGWMFAYESVRDNKLSLLSALPKSWYTMPFTAEKIGYSGGEVGICSDGDTITVSFSSPCKENCELVWRAKDAICEEDVLAGREFIREIRGNKLVLKSGLTSFKIKIL